MGQTKDQMREGELRMDISQIIQRARYGSDREFFADEVCQDEPCNNCGYGFSGGRILCDEHYVKALGNQYKSNEITPEELDNELRKLGLRKGVRA